MLLARPTGLLAEAVRVLAPANGKAALNAYKGLLQVPSRSPSLLPRDAVALMTLEATGYATRAGVGRAGRAQTKLSLKERLLSPTTGKRRAQQSSLTAP